MRETTLERCQYCDGKGDFRHNQDHPCIKMVHPQYLLWCDSEPNPVWSANTQNPRYNGSFYACKACGGTGWQSDALARILSGEFEVP